MFCSVLMEHPFHDAVKTCHLEDQLHERDVELTESRLQSLASSHRIEQLQERISDLEVLHKLHFVLCVVVPINVKLSSAVVLFSCFCRVGDKPLLNISEFFLYKIVSL